jgi:pyruvate formate lyase activating enzyme
VKGLCEKKERGDSLSAERTAGDCTGNTGYIFDIKKYAVDDGPGIRTTIFFKGCPLRCAWCHNPESQEGKEEISFHTEKCIGCSRCIKTCPSAAISIINGRAVTDADKCRICGRCAAICPSGAKKLIGRPVSTAQIVEQLEKDVIFYDQSGGGATFSGGEPLMQHRFLCSLLEECKKRRIHTAVDTSCYCQPKVLEEVANLADLFLCDLKHTDSQIHKKFTGVDNTTILENIQRLSAAGKKIIIRMPVIGGFNDDESNIEESGNFAASLKSLVRFDILPYHSGGMAKSERLADGTRQTKFKTPSDKQLEQVAGKLKKIGLNVRIGG